MAARCTTPPAAMHHFTGMDAPFARNQCTTFCGHTVLLGRCMQLLSCEFNMDTGCVELRYSNGSMISINCTAVEDEVANSRFQRSELDWLIYNDPLSYAELILNGDPEEYLRTVTEAPQLDFD